MGQPFPQTCFAPIVFITGLCGNWFAVTDNYIVPHNLLNILFDF
jgi:hypothetical protein